MDVGSVLEQPAQRCGCGIASGPLCAVYIINSMQAGRPLQRLLRLVRPQAAVPRSRIEDSGLATLPYRDFASFQISRGETRFVSEGG